MEIFKRREVIEKCDKCYRYEQGAKTGSAEQNLASARKLLLSTDSWEITGAERMYSKEEVNFETRFG